MKRKNIKTNVIFEGKCITMKHCNLFKDDRTGQIEQFPRAILKLGSLSS